MTTPATLPSTPNAIPGNYLPDMFGTGVHQSTGINQIVADILQAWTKLGITDSPAHDSPLLNTVLASLANGKSGWRQIVSADITDGTIATADLAANAATKVQSASFSGATQGTGTGTIGTVAFTTPAGVTEDVVVEFHTSVRNSAINNTTTFTVQIDSITAVSVNTVQQGPADATYQHNASGKAIFTGLTAGAHTAKVNATVAGGTSTFDTGEIIATEHRR